MCGISKICLLLTGISIVSSVISIYAFESMWGAWGSLLAGIIFLYIGCKIEIK